ncbi:GFA family protein [Ensifer sesbaniae]|jgi:hypothetical protein|uniref:GFA family protein n=1 Tax=Ensifer sesbaniae TaxID=1214071 RepID=UPI001569DA0D|nr:GFA family protein [Ensifer sesbaniae]MCK3777995.1 GFA family protein [Ensifer sesbaniae]NRQ17930.1 hypothetical protein [Ensifer sesbaniae]
MAGNGSYNGTCFCGAVEIEVSGDPTAMGFCHCSSCRTWSAGPVNAFTLWPPEKVRIVKGADNFVGYQKTATSVRKWCKVCGGHLMTEHPLWGVTDVSAAVIPALPFKPALHVNYQETVLPMKDGLPKYRDFPPAFGGTGELIGE